MLLRIVGCGEAFDSGLGNNSCLLLDQDGDVPVVLFDCGYQIPERLWAEPGLADRIDAIWISHLHADHYFGMVPLLSRFWEDQRKRPLEIIGPPGVAEVIPRALDLGYPGLRKRFAFDMLFSELTEGSTRTLGSLTFKAAQSRHSIMNLSLRVAGPNGASFGISGDGALSEGTRELFRDVDLLLHEVFSLEQGVPVHMDFRSLQEYAAGAGAGIRRIGVTHVSRNQRNELERAIQSLGNRDNRWFLPKPGMEIGFRHEKSIV